MSLNNAVAVTAAVPASVVDGIGTASLVLTLSGPKKTNQSRSKEEDCTKECKCNGGLEFAALIAVDRVDVIPVEDGTAAASDEVDENTKGDPEKNAENNIDWPMRKCARKRDEPNQGKEYSKGGDDFRVNESPLRTMGTLVLVKVFAIDTSNNGRKDELSAAED